LWINIGEKRGKRWDRPRRTQNCKHGRGRLSPGRKGVNGEVSRPALSAVRKKKLPRREGRQVVTKTPSAIKK